MGNRLQEAETYLTWSYQTSHLAFNVQLFQASEKDHGGVLLPLLFLYHQRGLFGGKCMLSDQLIGQSCVIFEKKTCGGNLNTHSADDAVAWFTATVVSRVET